MNVRPSNEVMKQKKEEEKRKEILQEIFLIAFPAFLEYLENEMQALC